MLITSVTRTRKKDGTFSVEVSTKAQISITIRADLAEKLKRFPNRSQYIERLLFENAANSQIVSIDWDYWEEWEALQDLQLMANHCLVKLAEHEERNPQADGEIEVLKNKVVKWLQIQNKET